MGRGPVALHRIRTVCPGLWSGAPWLWTAFGPWAPGFGPGPRNFGPPLDRGLGALDLGPVTLERAPGALDGIWTVGRGFEPGSRGFGPVLLAVGPGLGAGAPRLWTAFGPPLGRAGFGPPARGFGGPGPLGFGPPFGPGGLGPRDVDLDRPWAGVSTFWTVPWWFGPPSDRGPGALGRGAVAFWTALGPGPRHFGPCARCFGPPLDRGPAALGRLGAWARSFGPGPSGCRIRTGALRFGQYPLRFLHPLDNGSTGNPRLRAPVERRSDSDLMLWGIPMRSSSGARPKFNPKLWAPSRKAMRGPEPRGFGPALDRAPVALGRGPVRS